MEDVGAKPIFKTNYGGGSGPRTIHGCCSAPFSYALPDDYANSEEMKRLLAALGVGADGAGDFYAGAFGDRIQPRHAERTFGVR